MAYYLIRAPPSLVLKSVSKNFTKEKENEQKHRSTERTS